ncbi:immunity protein Tsi6 family protein [Agarivorans gilvus]|uniref:Tsi6 domain-containing protein n=1 Tax=Agarivorans gilvus TaxID=680279 RepID=A0ABQ1I7R2_9ALTE|nr:immunity protein Tsi6 family protein [Agarivorans gilvus]GGB22203.1 hypothetical protein GCM10007414_39490 [Agarivorans gilvus]
MNYKKLSEAANKALDEFSKRNVSTIDTVIYDSIIEQMRFINSEASLGHDPRKSLPDGKTFTYGIISSRAFASPDELQLKRLLEDVTSNLYPEDFC